MNDKQSYFIIFKIDNKQSHYARCMEFIINVENRQGLEDYLNGEKAAFIANMVHRAAINGHPDKRNNQHIIEDIEGGHVKVSPLNMQNLVRYGSGHQFNYYFHIDVTDNSDVAEFFYFTLMNQSSQLPKSRMMSCFFMNTESNVYRFSHFAQLLAQEYRDFYLSYGKSIREPDLRDTSRSLLPMIEINELSYEEIVRPRRLTLREIAANSSYSGTKLEREISHLMFEDDTGDIAASVFAYANSLITYGRGMLGLGSKAALIKKARGIAEAIVEVINAEGGISVLHYLLFGALLNNYIEKYKNEMDFGQRVSDCLTEALSFADGVEQILQNIVFHSENGKGLFAVRLHNYNQNLEYLSESGANFTSEDNARYRHLQVMVGDLNQTESIISNFLRNNEDTMGALSGASELISLSDFFGESDYGSISERWQSFRVAYPAKCQGLQKFSQAGRENGAVICARSSATFNITDEKSMWGRDFRKSATSFEAQLPYENAYLPGTQFTIIFPVASRKETRTRYPLESILKVTFETYTDFLEYAKLEVSSEPIAQAFCDLERAWSKEHIGYSLREKKAFFWNGSKEHWNKLLKKMMVESSKSKKKPLFVLDMKYFCSIGGAEGALWYESLCKGFIESDWISRRTLLCLAFTGYNVKFADAFRNTSFAARRALVGVKTQIYFTNGLFNDGHPDLLGGNIAVTEATLGIAKPEKNSKVMVERVPWECFNIPNDKNGVVESLKRHADCELKEGCSRKGFGCKLGETHINLGSKVHVDTFYEMAPHLMKQEVAKGVAFHLLQRLLDDDGFRELLNSRVMICLYGYAAYSRTIINAMYEMLFGYINKHEHTAELAFIIYQTKQPGETMDYEEQVYLSDSRIKEKPSKDLVIVQIVPISSTLTTFKKMWIQLSDNLKSIPKMPSHNLTVLWVRNEYKSLSEPSEYEDRYWRSCDPISKRIETSDSIIKSPFYVLVTTNKWEDPLTCKKCYPPSLGNERPIIKTDESSTVPTQQYYKRKEDINEDEDAEMLNKTANNAKRIAKLYGHIKYGHIRRAANHYQYYIDTQRYFRENKKKGIYEWLDGLKNDFENDKEYLIVSPQKPNNIEFSQYVNDCCFSGRARILYLDSEKHFRSNIELDHAEYISCFMTKSPLCIYVDTSISTGQTLQRIASLMNTIVRGRKTPFVFDKVFLLINRLSTDSKRSFVQNETKDFHAFVNLDISNMRTYGDSCIGCKLATEVALSYKAAATKQMSEYWQVKTLKNEAVFHEKWCSNRVDDDEFRRVLYESLQAKGFLRMLCTHTATSRLRAVRGKSEHDYFEVIKGLFEEGMDISIRETSCTDEKTDSPFIQYERLRILEKTGESLFEIQRKAGQSASFQQPLIKQERLKGTILASYIKTLSRPFFNYDFMIRACIADVLMLLIMIVLEEFDISNAMKALGNERELNKKAAFAKQNAQWRTNMSQGLKSLLPNADDKSCFLLVSLKALANLHMNFIFRKSVIEKINRFLIDNKQEFKDFYEHYARYIIQTMDCAGGGNKGYRLEVLLRDFCDFNKSTRKISKKDNDEFLSAFGLSMADVATHKVFEEIRSFLIIENNHILLDGVRLIYKETHGYQDDYQELLSQSHMWDFNRFLLLERTGRIELDGKEAGMDIAISQKCWLDANRELFAYLEEDMYLKKENGQPLTDDLISAEARNNALREKLECVARTYFDGCKLSIVARHRKENASSKYVMRERHFLVATDIVKDGEVYLEKIKIIGEELNELEKKEAAEGTFQTYGYYIGNDNIIIKFENNHKYMNKTLDSFAHIREDGYRIPAMEPVYLYIESLGPSADEARVLQLIRNILMYRYHLIARFEKDFNNDTMASIAWLNRSTMLLTAQKAGDHQERDDVDSVQRTLSHEPWPVDVSELQCCDNDYKKEIFDMQKALRSNYSERIFMTLLRSYVNLKIGRMYRAMLFCEALHNPLPYKNLYRSLDERKENKYGKQALETLSKTFMGVDGESIVAMKRIGDEAGTAALDLKGLSRKNWLKSLLEVLEIDIIGKTGSHIIGEIDDFEKYASDFEFLSFKLEKGNFGYCSEYFACLLLDFFFSAMKYGVYWSHDIKHYDIGSVERFLYFKNNVKTCKIRIRRESGEQCTVKPFDRLVLEADFVRRADYEEREGMSVPSLRWYTDSLWKQFYIDNSIELKKHPEVIKESVFEQNPQTTPIKGVFRLSLPVLKK